jgi:hypothetical protein
MWTGWLLNACVSGKSAMTHKASDRNIDALWAEEAERRIDAYERGEIDSIPIDKVMDKCLDWHKDELLEREAEGSNFSEWKDAKREIRDCAHGLVKLSDNSE